LRSPSIEDDTLRSPLTGPEEACWVLPGPTLGAQPWPLTTGAPGEQVDEPLVWMLQNNVKGLVYENIIASKFSREGRSIVLRPVRRGGIDAVSLEGTTVVLNEAKFQNKHQYSDFSAITTNLTSNIQEVITSLEGNTTLSRSDKKLIRSTLDLFLQGNVPTNLRIRIITGKAPVGPRVQRRITNNTGGIPVDFGRYP
jgi:hypothetical protein